MHRPGHDINAEFKNECISLTSPPYATADMPLSEAGERLLLCVRSSPEHMESPAVLSRRAPQGSVLQTSGLAVVRACLQNAVTFSAVHGSIQHLAGETLQCTVLLAGRSRLRFPMYFNFFSI
jgi:hypothetical protein